MPWTFRKSFPLPFGLRLNVNRKSVSVTFGDGTPVRRTISSNGTRTTSVNFPGPFGFRKRTERGRRP
ncbi:DUF4236 domain-containing protein [Streptomyces nanshensis]|uniref:DUF4236 domain-containing protein n=1 Tax=Streptomyces nanshensis TaxID=518642 RepID=A0A1E7KZF4_9ACTN|nr:DUF4236 domain-containing protein [Streptomyces nanshensis]OEV09310.1 hypothetical protein AN218_23030 [Streptomyces nanshensis]